MTSSRPAGYPSPVWTSAARLIAGFVVLATSVTLGLLMMVPLVFSRAARIKLTNVLGHIIGPTILWICGCEAKVEGREAVRRGSPAIFCGNHTSILDAFTAIWLAPIGTVGVAKKEILYYPFYGLGWWLSGHLMVDRQRTSRAKAGLEAMGEFIKARGLSLFMWPEGTRAKDGRMLPFKKGIIHLALKTRLPIVPMLTIGAHRAWQRSPLRLVPTSISIRFLAPISTSSWEEDSIDLHVAELERAFLDALPPDQQPSPRSPSTVSPLTQSGAGP